MTRRSRRAVVPTALVLGVAADLLFGDPQRGHPVAVFGTAAQRVEERLWRDRRAWGVVHVAGCVGVVAAVGAAAERWSGRARLPLIAASAWAVLGGRSLASEADAVADLLERGDLDAARARLTHLVGRETSQLSVDEVARAVVESVAENCCDAVVAPLFWGAVGGTGGLLGYRAVNTLDAMIGHRSPRYRNFGWAAARLDDLANLLPARLGSALIACCAPAVHGSPAAALRVTRRWGRAHPSPNAGMSEAAFAGALGVRLGGRNVYHGAAEERPVIGTGRAATPADIVRANRLLKATTVAATAACAVLAARPRRRR